jgi:pyruvate dehydrogenase E1 component alpha subunit
MSFHNTTDNPSLYRDPEEYQEALRRDPIERVQKYLASLGLWDQSREGNLTEELRHEIDSALEAAVAAPLPGPRDLFDNIYEHPPERVLRQRADLLDGQR